MTYKNKAKTSLENFDDIYYIGGMYKGLRFWDRAELIEMIEDACEFLGVEHKTRLQEMIDTSMIISGEDWSHNPWYDDILWMIGAFYRAAEILDNPKYYDIAKANFDYITNSAIMDNGLVNWKKGVYQPCSVSTLNYVINACRFYKSTGEEQYLTFAINRMEALFTHLYNFDNGHVYDHLEPNEVIKYRENAQNTGLFLRACADLYDLTGNERYFNEIDKAASFFIGKEWNGEAMHIHQPGDAAGFKAIFSRHLRYVSDKFNLPQYLEWMRFCADTAWSNRNKYGLICNDFCIKTPDHRLFRAFDCHCAVVLFIQCVEKE